MGIHDIHEHTTFSLSESLLSVTIRITFHVNIIFESKYEKKRETEFFVLSKRKIKISLYFSPLNERQRGK